ncbi:MAG TPA: hypothetical protein VGH11_19200 [Jatrophihabitans sp.]|jgi:hypothetical protein
MNTTTREHVSMAATVKPNAYDRQLRRDARDRAATHVYDAECVLHAARQSAFDVWIAAASDKLHLAILELEAAEAA